ncbi:MAG: hypothetical protein QOD60_1472 [Solirubrobacterales bacterium]|nr:hypothetical protein [Solirubrobacterales bacterium]
MFGKRLCGLCIGAVAITAALTLATAAPAAAGTQVGETFDPTIVGGSGVTYLQVASPGGQYTVPFTGVITSWSFQAPATTVPSLKFKVGRHVAGNDFMIVGSDGPRDPVAGMLNTFPVTIPVQAGDVIGDFRASSGAVQRPAGFDYLVQTMLGDPAPGATPTFDAASMGTQLDLSANLEPLAPTPTGQRAAALKKCKKKHSRKKRKKCRKKALLLPV